jgi:hypothetical protein
MRTWPKVIHRMELKCWRTLTSRASHEDVTVLPEQNNCDVTVRIKT